MLLTSPQQIPNFRRLKVKVLQILTYMFKIKNSNFFKTSIFIQDANKINRSNQSNDRELSRKPVNNLIPETNNNLCNFNLNAQDQRLPNYINRTGQQPDRQFQHTQTTENPFVPRKAQQQPVTSSINFPKTQLKSFSGDPLRWHDWLSFFQSHNT